MDISKGHSYKLLPVFIAGCLAIGFLGGLATSSSLESWYVGIQKPPLNPPSWVFAPVWSALYILMGIAGWRIWVFRGGERSSLKILFSAQFVFNLIWSFLFFGLRSPLAGLIDIFLLWTALLLLAGKAFCTDKVTGFLLMPYFLWVSFAFYLNFAIWRLNP